MTHFSDDEKRGLYRAIYERRDVRSHFLPDPVPDDVLARILDAAHHAPSVGFMQPWDFIVIRDPSVRNEVRENFERANQQASAIYESEKRTLYDTLKLAAIVESPLNLCVTCDHHRNRGAGLGRQSNPTNDLYSTVCAVQNLWLAARAESLRRLGQHPRSGGSQNNSGDPRARDPGRLPLHRLRFGIRHPARRGKKRLGAPRSASQPHPQRSLDNLRWRTHSCVAR